MSRPAPHSNQQRQNAVEALLMRLELSETIPIFRSMGVDRIVGLRKLSEADLRQAIPNDAKRNALLEVINSRGNIQPRRAPQVSSGIPNPPRSADADMPRWGMGGFEDSNNNNNRGGRGGGGQQRGGGGGGAPRGGGGGGRGRGGQRGGGMGGGGFSNMGGPGDEPMRPCRHYFSNEGCRFGDECRYSHDEIHRERMAETSEENNARANEDLAARHEFVEECDIPTDRIRFLLGVNGVKMRSINEQCGTFNERFTHIDEDKEIFKMKLYGDSRESVQKAKDMVLIAVGVRKEEEKRNRFQYTVNELDANTHAVRLLAACNTKNAGTTRHLSDVILRSVISSFRFVKPQQVRHFYKNTGNSDKDKLEVVSKIVSQLKGVQAILFCEHKRVEEMCKGAQRIARYFNGVEPKFVYRSLTKEARMEALEEFKQGVENENGVKQRLLVTNEDYAKLARKTVIPYVNLVINFALPRSEEFYVLQSLVAGRQGTVGASFLCVSSFDEVAFRDLSKNIEFQEFTTEESFRSTAMELSYDTHAEPLTPENAEPLPDWREHLNDKKPKPPKQPKKY